MAFFHWSAKTLSSKEMLMIAVISSMIKGATFLKMVVGMGSLSHDLVVILFMIFMTLLFVIGLKLDSV